MKKIFTLICMAFVAMSVNAQDSYIAIDDEGNIHPDFTGATLEGTDLVATITKGHVTVKGVSSKTPKDVETEDQTASYTKETWPAEWWNDAEWKKFNKTKKIWHWKNGVKGTNDDVETDFQFNAVVGTGNPVTGWKSEPVINEGTYTGKIRAVYDGYYFEPGKSTSVPASGEYFTFKADVAGMFKIGFAVANGANRYMYIVEQSTVRTLETSEYKVEGYVNGVDNELGEPLWQASIKVNADRSIGNEHGQTWKDDAWTDVNELNQPKFGWFVFDAKANETYYIFTPNTQFGFRDCTFTAGATIADYTPTNPGKGGTSGINEVKSSSVNENAAIYNLAGQKVSKDFKGVKIQNGKKFF